MIGSSETTREPPFHFHFDDFFRWHLPEQKKTIEPAFLEWFIGFLEGDGCFLSRYADGRYRATFEIKQKNVQTLAKIRARLGFGRIYASGPAFTYSVGDRRGIQRIMALCNGNLVLPKRRQQFDAWVTASTSLHHPTFQWRPSCREVSLESGWLAGFVDAEGCLDAQITRPGSRSRLSHRLTQRVHLTQEDRAGERAILVQIGSLLGSPALVHCVKPPRVWRLEMSSLASHAVLIAYLQRFPLVEKALVYKRWWRIYLARERGEHLRERGLRKLTRLCRELRHGAATDEGGRADEEERHSPKESFGGGKG